MKSTLLRLIPCGLILAAVTMSGTLRADDSSAKDGATCTKCQKHHHCHGKKKDKDASSANDSSNS